MDKFIEKQFVTELYTIEYETTINGEKIIMYSSGGTRPSFSNTGGKVWKSIRDIKLHLIGVGNGSVMRHYLEHSPVVVHYQLVGGSIVKEVVCLLSSLV